MLVICILFHAAVLLYNIYNVYAVLILRDSFLGCWTWWDWAHCLSDLCTCPQSKMNRCQSVQFECFRTDTHQCCYSRCRNSEGRTETVAHTTSHQKNCPGHSTSQLNSILFLPSTQLECTWSNHHKSPPIHSERYTCICKQTFVQQGRFVGRQTAKLFTHEWILWPLTILIHI